MRDYLPEIIFISATILLTVLICAATIFGVIKSNTKHDEKLWNDGHCDICGDAWEYEQAVGHRSSTSYIYVCEDCGKRIELYEVR